MILFRLLKWKYAPLLVLLFGKFHFAKGDNISDFSRSDASSWSKNIHLERLVRKKTRYDKPNEILISG